MSERKNYLTIHGHFYQPPRENPWLESVETQESAAPFHDWNERINFECYNPNSVSKIVDSRNKILDLVNNYEYMSFNFGATLLSWMEQNAPQTYDRIIKADIESVIEHNGHGNALAQVYNHIIMPLANYQDKQAQVKWGIKDFFYRFGRQPEGMWLAETAVDDETLSVLVDNGIKFTVLSPYQALRCKKIEADNWQDVSWGNIDPARPYRYYLKNGKGKYIDLFFYDGAISKSVAFDELLKDGNKFIRRLKEGVSNEREYPQLVNIATDGESYGHHTKFGDMALAYVVKVRAEDEGFQIVNYGEFLDKFGVKYEVDIKQASSWSCFHGVGRWSDDCGCSTGGHPGWNQKWRKPLREALNMLRDKLLEIYESEGKKYFKDIWNARNNYIDVILDRSILNVKKYQKANFVDGLSGEEKVSAMKLLEIQRQSLLMFTSCGWFFSEISGIETTQIMKYAARAIQLAKSFTAENLEEEFLSLLENAQSNIKEYGSGRDIYEKFVKPSVVSIKQIASLWAISSLFKDFEEEEDLYCYTMKKIAYKKVSKGSTNFVVAHLEIKSNITLETFDTMIVLIQYQGGDFHCAIKDFTNQKDYLSSQEDLIKTFLNQPLTEIIRKIDEYFGSKYFTLKDIFIEERKNILAMLLKDQMDKFAETYRKMYNDGKSSIQQMQSLGLDIPDEFKISAQYALTKKFNDLFDDEKGYIEDDVIQEAVDINFEIKLLGIDIDKMPTSKIFSEKILQNISRLANNLEYSQAEAALDIFDKIEKLDMDVEISEAQNIFFSKIFIQMGDILYEFEKSHTKRDKDFLEMLFSISTKLNINSEFYRTKFDRILLEQME
ncbi:DUF3536 domain-containing protein [bacterium]|nr:DUF3536 domain-containing protein [bacterium]